MDGECMDFRKAWMANAWKAWMAEGMSPARAEPNKG